MRKDISTEHLKVSYQDRVAIVTLKRQQRNSWIDSMCVEFESVYQALDADDSVGAIIMTGNGSIFCAGADLDPKNSPFGEGGSTQMSYRDGGGRAALAIWRCRKPTIAAINGVAVGVGITITLCQDFRVIAKDTKIGFVFDSRGIVAESCSSFFLPKLVGHSNAMALIGSARVVSANHKWCDNLFTIVVDQSKQVLDEALTLAKDLVKRNSAVSHAISKSLVWAPFPSPVEAHIWESFAMFETTSKDGKEGIQSFLEKRDPVFKGRLEDPAVKGFIDKLRSRL